MLIYNLCLWLFTRDNIYLIYSVYLFLILFVLASTGIGEHLVWGNNIWFRYHAYRLTLCSAFLPLQFLSVTSLTCGRKVDGFYG